jgi:hypothetical protein
MLLLLMIIMGYLGYLYAYLLIDLINYVATWGQGLFLAEPIVPPIPPLPGWAHAGLGVIAALVLEDIYSCLKFKIKRKLLHRRSHSKGVK